MNRFIFSFISLTSIFFLSISSCFSQNSESNINEQKVYEYLTDALKKFNASNKGNINFVAAAAISTPCVVHIKTKAKVRQVITHPFYDFFGNDFFHRNPTEQTQEGSGSGVIVSNDGYIVTNHHVIQNADDIEVILRNKVSYIGKVIGKDTDTDLALIKIEAKNLTPLNMANSDSVQVGEWVLAVGNPFNLESTVTQGIVSAKGRSLNLNRNGKSNSAIESFIQTDAAVNPGNSGGALVNLNGELIGINTAIASPTGAYAGYAFAVPSNLVKKVVEDLKQFGTVQRAFLGIEISNLNSESAKQLNLSELKGIIVERIGKNSAAEISGILPKDVITKINQIEINSSSEFMEQVSKYRPGDKIKITYLRNGITIQTDAILKNKENTTDIIKLDENYFKKLGIEVETISNQEANRLRITNGVKVTKINDGLIQKSTALQVGFIIRFINDKPVKNEQEMLQILKEIEKGTVIFEGIYPNRPYTYQFAFRLQ
jgi:Do/DeqQ family serine protease